jgi:hypothetical protein
VIEKKPTLPVRKVILRVCKVCRTHYTPKKPMQSVCGPYCAESMAVSKRGKALKVAQVQDRRETKQKLDQLKSKATWAKEAQAAVNAFIRTRDATEPCISCGRWHQGQWHAGHYLSVGARPELRYDEANVHKQCAPCNTHLSGNAVLYRVSLIEKIGIKAVEALEGPHEPRRDTVDSLKALKAEYVAKTKQRKETQA